MAPKVRSVKRKLNHKSAHRSVVMVQTTVCFPQELRAFVLAESGKPYPGSIQPMGVSRWIQKLILDEKKRVERRREMDDDAALLA